MKYLNIDIRKPENRKYIDTLLESQKLNPQLALYLPFNGGLVLGKDKTPIAAGWIRVIEGNNNGIYYGMLDGYVSNANVKPSLRNKALNLLTIKLIEVAKELKIKKLIAFTIKPEIVNRAKEQGFSELVDYKVIAMNIK